jgi:hypothetical protein
VFPKAFEAYPQILNIKKQVHINSMVIPLKNSNLDNRKKIRQ